MALPNAAGLRERKKQQVRAALHRSALNLFAEKGFAATSIDEIVAAADVSRSTFFRYYPSKESVLFDGYDEAGEALTQRLRQRPATKARSRHSRRLSILKRRRPIWNATVRLRKPASD